MAVIVKRNIVEELVNGDQVLNYLATIYYNRASSPYEIYGRMRIADRVGVPDDAAEFNVGLLTFGRDNMTAAGLLCLMSDGNVTVISVPTANLVLRP